MSTYTSEVEELLLLYKCVVHTGSEVLTAFAERKLLSGYKGSLVRFLDDKKHEIFHLWQCKKLSCCDCPAAGCNLKRMSLMSSSLFRKIYDGHGLEVEGHTVCTSERIVQVCLHKYITRNIAIHELDLSEILFLFRNCLRLSPNEIDALDTIPNYRNQICQAYAMNDFTKDFFSRAWTDLKSALVYLTDFDYKHLIRKQIQHLRKYHLQKEEITELLKNIVEVNTVLQELNPSGFSDNKAILTDIKQNQESTPEHFNLGAKEARFLNPSYREKTCQRKFVKEDSFEKPVCWNFLPPEHFKLGAGKVALRNPSNKGESFMQKVAKEDRTYAGTFVCDGLFIDCIVDSRLEETTKDRTYSGTFVCDWLFIDCIVDRRLEETTKERQYPDSFLCDGIFVDCIVAKNLQHRKSEVIEDKEEIKSTNALNKLLSLKEVVQHDKTEDLITKMHQTAVNIDEDLAFRYILGYSKNRIVNVDDLHQVLIHTIRSKNTNCAKAVAWEITRRFSSSVLITQYHDIWPAFQCVCKTKNTFNLLDVSCSANLSNVVLVAEVNKGTTVLSRIDSFHGIPIIYKEVNGLSKEAMCIVKQVDGLEVANTPLSTIKGVCSEVAKKYFTKHSKLSMFSKSHLKSKGFGHKNQNFECVPCIQLFCRAKGLIPIGESHFPEKIRSIQTDILEGYPQLNAQSNIRIGAKIIVPTVQADHQSRPSQQLAGIDTEEIIPRYIRCGTIGGFLRYHGEDAFLTCAHVICDWKCLVKGKSGIDIHDNPVKIFCPSVASVEKMFPCGQLAGLAFPPDEGMGISVDAAIVKIDQALAKSYIDTTEENEMKSKYLHQCCLDWRELGVSNMNLEVHAKGSVSPYQNTEYDVKILDQSNVESETFDQACYNVYHNIKPADMTDDIHLIVQAVKTVSQEQSVNPVNIMYLNQIVMQKIECRPGDSGMCIYVRNTADGKLWCIGMAVATDPSGGCIVTPLKAILKHFNYKC